MTTTRSMPRAGAWSRARAVRGAILWLVVLGAALAAPRGAGAAGVKAGDKAPPFGLRTLDDKGQTLTLASLTGAKGKQGTVLVFVSCKCPYVAQARQPLADLYKQFGAKVSFVGVNANANETLSDIKADAASSFPFPLVRDFGAKVADAYGAERTPEVFLIDGTGVVRYHGGVGDLGAALAELTAGKPISKPDAKAFGCTIKRTP
jgi:peroxiredoxin